MFFKSFNSFCKKENFIKIENPFVYSEKLNSWFNKEEKPSNKDVKKDFNMEIYNYLKDKVDEEKAK